MKQKLKNLRAWFIRALTCKIRGKGRNILELNGAELRNCTIEFYGEVNHIQVAPGAKLWDCTLKIIGQGNSIIIQKDCRLRGCEIVAEDRLSQILIGAKTTATKTTIVASEGKGVHVGEDCMFASGVVIRSSDGHSIIDYYGQRVNPASHVCIGRHVWLGLNVVVLKGVDIAHGSIVGAGSIVNKDLFSKCLYAGVPAKAIQTDITWKRERI